MQGCLLTHPQLLQYIHSHQLKEKNVCKHAHIKMRYVCDTKAVNLPATSAKVSSFEIRYLGKCIIWKLYSHNCFLHFGATAPAKFGLLVFWALKHARMFVNISPAAPYTYFHELKEEDKNGGSYGSILEQCIFLLKK